MFDKYALSRYFGSFLQLGFGPKESAVLATYDGNFITRVDDGAVLNVAQGIFREGATLNLNPGPKTPKEHDKHEKMQSRYFVINSEGSISPSACPLFALGISQYSHLHLVKRNAPHRVIFSNATTLTKCQSE